MAERMGAVVIVGAGQAGTSCALTLRRGGWAGPVTLVGDEPHLPYERPPLSKKVIVREADPHELVLADADLLRELSVDHLHGVVTDADLRERVAVLGDGTRLRYEHLVLATGAVPRPLPITVPGGDAHGVRVIRTIDDASAVRELLGDGAEVVVIGGGFIGVEAAAAMAAHGHRVTLLEMLPSLLARVAPAALGDWVAGYLSRLGVAVHTGTSAAGVEVDDEGRATAVLDREGRRHPAQVVVVGIGAAANGALAESIGLETDGAVVVDGRLLTSDAAVSAIGDCAVQVRADGSRHRHESVQCAQDQGSYVAHRLLGQAEEEYSEVPWFWSDVADARIEMAGRVDLASTFVTRGDPGADDFSLFGFDGDAFVGVVAVNRPREYAAGRKFLRDGRTLTRDVVADESVDLRALSRRR
jgi:3-phenylpropionate/trans-cinnamate dioxygenase ferredoxin reductase component